MAVKGVPKDRVAYGTQVYAELVRASRYGLQLKTRSTCRGRSRVDSPAGLAGLATLKIDDSQGPTLPICRNGKIYRRPGMRVIFIRWCQRTLNYRHIGFGDAPFSKCDGQRPLHLLAACHQHESRRGLI